MFPRYSPIRRFAVLPFVAICLLALSSLTLVSCQTDPLAEALKHIANGDKYLAQQKYPEAILEYKIAISRVSVSSVAHYQLAEAYAKSDDFKNAFQEYVKAADLAPERDDLQIKVGNILLVARQFQDAKTRARVVLQRDPNSVPAIVLLGNALAGLRDLENAIELGRRAVELDPERSGMYRNLAAMEMLRGNSASAELAFKRALELDPRSIRAWLSLGELYRVGGARAKAEDAFKRALGIEPNNPTVNQGLAWLYIEWNRATEAEPYLQSAAKHSTDPDVTLALADYYLAIGRVNDSKVVLEKLASTTKEAFTPARTRLAFIEYASGRRAEGHRLLDDALAKDSKNPRALAMKARLLLGDNKVEEALATANAAVNADPRSPEAHLTLGRVRLARQEKDDARRAFNEALTLQPQGIEAQLELAKLHLERGEIETAIDFAKQGLKTQPDSLEAQLMVVRSMAARSDDKGQAEAMLKGMVAKYPKAPRVFDMLGNLALARKDSSAAKAAWERALALDPNDVGALAGIASLHASANRPADAWKVINTRLLAAPNNPNLLVLGAKVRIINKDSKGAEELLKKALAADPSSLEAYGLLGQMYVVQHRIEAAMQQFSELLRQEPESVAVHTVMGVLSEAVKDTNGAITWYQRALQLDEHAAVAANNLAWIYLTRNTEIENALRLAEIARGALPNQPEFIDTLGWAYYKKQLAGSAIEALERAVELAPKNPTYHYHLGMAYVLDGTDPKARQALQQALKLNPNFERAEEARAALKALVY